MRRKTTLLIAFRGKSPGNGSVWLKKKINWMTFLSETVFVLLKWILEGFGTLYLLFRGWGVGPNSNSYSLKGAVVMAMNWDLSVFQKQKLQLSAQLILSYNSLVAGTVFFGLLVYAAYKRPSSQETIECIQGKKQSFPPYNYWYFSWNSTGSPHGSI